MTARSDVVKISTIEARWAQVDAMKPEERPLLLTSCYACGGPAVGELVDAATVIAGAPGLMGAAVLCTRCEALHGTIVP